MKMKKVVLVALITAGMLTGCLGRGSNLDAGSSRIYITQEGVLKTETVETYEDHEYYNVDELKAFLEEAVTAYNGANGQDAVVLDSCSMEKGKARMVYSYASGENLVGFTEEYKDTENQVDSIAVGFLSERLAQIEANGTIFLKASNGKQADTEALIKKGDCHVVVIETQKPVTVQTQEKLLFISDNVIKKDGHTVELAQGKNYIIFK